MRAHASSRAVADRRWDEIGSFADLALPSYGGSYNFDALLVSALVATGHPDGRRRCRRSSREAAPDACPGTRSRHSSHSPSWTRPQSTRTEALGIASRQRLVLKEIDALELLAIDAGRTGDALRASRLKSAAAAARDQIGYRFQWPTHAADLETIAVDDSPVDRARRRDRIRAPWARRTPPPSVRVGRTHARGAGRGSASRRRRHHAGRRDATPRQQVDGQDTSRSHLRQARHQQPSRTGDRSHPSFRRTATTGDQMAIAGSAIAAEIDAPGRGTVASR